MDPVSHAAMLDTQVIGEGASKDTGVEPEEGIVKSIDWGGGGRVLSKGVQLPSQYQQIQTPILRQLCSGLNSITHQHEVCLRKEGTKDTAQGIA